MGRAVKAKSPAQQTRAERNIAWIEEYCRVPEGMLVGQPVVLREWQRTELRKIYDNPAGTRRAILSFGRKNGKTALAAFVLLLHLVGPEARPNSQLVSAAQSKDQAALLFQLASKVVKLNPSLSEYVQIRAAANLKELYCPALGTLYRALAANAPNTLGLSPVLIVHDELGQVRGPDSDLYEALETATGAQQNPLSIIISTQAATDLDLLSVLIDDAKKGLDPRTVLSLYTAPPELDPFGDEALLAANPAFGDFMNAAEARAMGEDAKRMPSRENKYRNLVLNQRVETHSPFVSRSVWEACGGEVSEDWGDAPVFVGMDLSSTSDLTAMVMIAEINGAWEVKPTFWLPEEGLIEKGKEDRVPYDLWRQQGFLKTTPGKSIEYEWVAEEVMQAFDDYNIDTVAFDRWNFRNFKPWLTRAGLSDDMLARFHEFGQGTRSMSPALRTLESVILQERMRHGGHPVLTMHMALAAVENDKAGGRKFNKPKSRARIDGAVALAMAFGVAGVGLTAPTTPPAFDLYFF